MTVREPHRVEQHRLSGTLHYIQDDSRFACGRIRGSNYLDPMIETVHDAPVCEQKQQWLHLHLERVRVSCKSLACAVMLVLQMSVLCPIHCCMNTLVAMSCVSTHSGMFVKTASCPKAHSFKQTWIFIGHF